MQIVPTQNGTDVEQNKRYWDQKTYLWRPFLGDNFCKGISCYGLTLKLFVNIPSKLPSNLFQKMILCH